MHPSATNSKSDIDSDSVNDSVDDSLENSLENRPYVGRFAPSPTGPLHFGSLIAALASYLDARSHQGRWLLRMEDLDPPREPPGAASQILSQLTQLGLHWDDEVLYQSSQLEHYEEVLAQLQAMQMCFPCDCSRPQVKAMGSVYDGSCRGRREPPAKDYALRLKTRDLEIGFHDLVQAHYQQNIAHDIGDFVVRRKDRLFAYQLAVVVDDQVQGITHVIRGFDLLDSTPRQIYLQQLLGYAQPNYGHIPILVDQTGQKLSKQRFAPAIEASNGKLLHHEALQFLGQSPPATHKFRTMESLLEWAIENWDIQAVPKLANIPQESPE